MDSRQETVNSLRAEHLQRSSFQHAYFIANVGVCGAVISFTLTENINKQISQYALLIVPLISLCFFMLWYNHALFIMERGRYLET